MAHFKVGDKVKVVKPDGIKEDTALISTLEPEMCNGWVSSMDKYIGETSTIRSCGGDGYLTDMVGFDGYGFLPEWLEFVEEKEEEIPEGVEVVVTYVVTYGKLGFQTKEFDSLDKAKKFQKGLEFDKTVNMDYQKVISTNEDLYTFLDEHKEAVLEYLKD